MLPNWEDMTDDEREQYVNQDFVKNPCILTNIEQFDNNDRYIEMYTEFFIGESEITEKIWNVLTSKQKYAIILFYIYGKTQREIGKKVGVTHQAISRLIRRAKDRLRKHFRK